jgi:hypothetical protein
VHRSVGTQHREWSFKCHQRTHRVSGLFPRINALL